MGTAGCSLGCCQAPPASDCAPNPHPSPGPSTQQCTLLAVCTRHKHIPRVPWSLSRQVSLRVGDTAFVLGGVQLWALPCQVRESSKGSQGPHPWQGLQQLGRGQAAAAPRAGGIGGVLVAAVCGEGWHRGSRGSSWQTQDERNGPRTHGLGSGGGQQAGGPKGGVSDRCLACALCLAAREEQK